METSSAARPARETPDQLADIDAGSLVNRHPSIWNRIERGLLQSPHKPAIICMHQSRNHLAKISRSVGADSGADKSDVVQHDGKADSDYLGMTYAQLHAAGLKFAKGLAKLHIHPGANMLCIINNGFEYALLLWAGVVARLTHSPVDTAVLEHGKYGELRCYLEILRPKVVVVPCSRHIDLIERAAKQSGVVIELGIFIEHDDDFHTRKHWRPLSEVLDQETVTNIHEESEFLDGARFDDPERISSIMFTSGTSSGRPKGCPSSVASQTHTLESQAWLINKDNSARVLQQAHNSRAVGLLHALLTWQVGGALVMPSGSSFSLHHTVDAILHHKVTFVALSPALVHTIGQELLSRGARMGDWDHIKTIQVGGDAVTKEVLEKCTVLFPRAQVVVNHGMSEGAGSFVWPFYNSLVNKIPFFAGTLSPVGLVARGTRVVIWDSKRAEAAPRGQPGEMLVCSASLIQQYLGGEPHDNKAFFNDKQDRRWMKTGDVAVMNRDGLIYILGRSKHAINKGGFSIMPAIVESCIESLTGQQVRETPL